MWDDIRAQQLADNIRQDFDLLKGYEDELRFATEPRLIAKYKHEIERQRQSIALNQREYDEVMKSAQDVIESHPISEKELQDTLYDIQQTLSEIRQSKTGQYSPQLVSEVEKVSMIVDDPKLDSNHKLKYSIPIIPLILSYEGEIELKSGLNLKKVWQNLKARLVLEFLSSNTVASTAKFLIEKVVEYKKNKGTDKEVEALKNQLETYKEKTQFMEKELQQFKEIAGKLETKLGSGYISENAYVNWSLDAIKPKTPAFKIEIWTEKGDDSQGARDIVLVPKTKSYRIGDMINLYFRAEKDCYLTLINYGTSGKMTVLLPNALSQDNFIKASRIYTIPGEDYPFDYILSGPPGTERIKAIGTTRKINLIDMKFNKDEVFKISSAAARDISVVAKKIESAAPEEWAEAMCEFEVI